MKQQKSPRFYLLGWPFCRLLSMENDITVAQAAFQESGKVEFSNRRSGKVHSNPTETGSSKSQNLPRPHGVASV